MIGGFFDDSGTHANSPLVVIGGLLGTDAQWDIFADHWKALLACPLPDKEPLSSFHLSNCRAGEGEFERYRKAERDRVEFLFRQVILEAGLFTLGMAIDKLAWDELVVGSLFEKLGTPLECCFTKIIDMTIDTIRERRPGERIYLFFDQGVQLRLAHWREFYLSQTERYPEIEGIAYAPVSRVEALQGADMIAYATYQYGLQWLEDRQNPKINPHFRDFLRREFTVGRIITRELVEELIEKVG